MKNIFYDHTIFAVVYSLLLIFSFVLLCLTFAKLSFLIFICNSRSFVLSQCSVSFTLCGIWGIKYDTMPFVSMMICWKCDFTGVGRFLYCLLRKLSRTPISSPFRTRRRGLVGTFSGGRGGNVDLCSSRGKSC